MEKEAYWRNWATGMNWPWYITGLRGRNLQLFAASGGKLFMLNSTHCASGFSLTGGVILWRG